MELKTLKKIHIKRNILLGVIALFIISAVILQFTKAKYRTTESIPLVNGTINYTLPDLNIVAITIDGEESDTLPEGNYKLLDTSYCTIEGEKANVTINWDTEEQALSITPFTTKNTKCHLDFSKLHLVTITYAYAEGEEGNNPLPSINSQLVPTNIGIGVASPWIEGYTPIPDNVEIESVQEDMNITVLYYIDQNGNGVPDSIEPPMN